MSTLLVNKRRPVRVKKYINISRQRNGGIRSFSGILSRLFTRFNSDVTGLRTLLRVRLSFPVGTVAHMYGGLDLPGGTTIRTVTVFRVTCNANPTATRSMFLTVRRVPFVLGSRRYPRGGLLAVRRGVTHTLALG